MKREDFIINNLTRIKRGGGAIIVDSLVHDG
jgi:hypothetical protein